MTTYKVLNPHPETVKAWQAVAWLPDELGVASTEQTVLAKIGQAKTYPLIDPTDNRRIVTMVQETKETSERPIKREINKFYRITENDTEFIYFVETLHGETFNGPRVDHSRIVGRYDVPEFEKLRNRETGGITITGIRGNVKNYEIPFGQKINDPSTGEQTTLDELGKLASKTCKFYVFIGTAKWEVQNISLQEYMSANIEDLRAFAKFGKWPEKTSKKSSTAITRDPMQ